MNKIEPISKQCREETGATLEQVNKIRSNAVFEDDPKLKKHVLCVAKKTGQVSESGTINVEGIKNNLKKVGTSDETIAEIEKCLLEKDTAEETAFQVMKCVFDRQPNFSPAD